MSAGGWVADLVKHGYNAMCNAPAGYGKTKLIKKLLRPALRNKHKKESTIWITASTSLAALAIDGTTIHSAAGLQRGNGTVEKIVEDIMKRPRIVKRWRGIRVIVIEEFSLISARFLDLLDGVAKSMKHNTQPFGGVQVVLVGDVFQLKPVPDWVAVPELGRSRASGTKRLASIALKVGPLRLLHSSCSS